MKPEHKALYERIDQFLEHHRTSDGGWASVEDGDERELGMIIDQLLWYKYDEDADGDLPINFMIVDRNKERFILNAFQNRVSYMHEDSAGAFKEFLSALRYISEQIELVLRAFDFEIVEKEVE